MFGKDKNAKGAAGAAPGSTPQEGDVKVPIEDDNDKPEDAPSGDPTSEQGAAAQPAGEACDPEAEQRMVDEAIRRGEEAADEDFKAENAKLRASLADLRRELEEVRKSADSEELEQAKKAAADAEERRTKLLAEFQTFRRRRDEEAVQEKARAAEKIVKSLLPVIDDMERAIDHAEKTAGDDEQFQSFVSGIDQVHDKMVAVLAKEGVEVIDPAGEPFDPMLHQAVGRSENPDVYDETVDQVYQKGYKLGGKVIRSAMVTVTFGGPKRPAPDPAAGADGVPADGAAGGAQGADPGPEDASESRQQ